MRRLIENRLSIFDLAGIKWRDVETAARGISHAEVARACDDAARGAVLSGENTISSQNLAQALRNRGSMRSTSRRRK